jgi:hypothetical protein
MSCVAMHGWSRKKYLNRKMRWKAFNHHLPLTLLFAMNEQWNAKT